MQLAARLTLLNAFISNGSVLSQYLDMRNELQWVECVQGKQIIRFLFVTVAIASALGPVCP